MTELNRSYAEALFAVAFERGETEAVSEGLDYVKSAFESEPDYFTFLLSPGISKKDRASSFDKVFGGRIPECLLSFLGVMCINNKMKCFNGAATEYKKLLSESKSVTAVNVTSAIALTDSEKEKLTKKLESISGKKVIISYTVDSSVIGGLKIVTDGFIMDGTVKKRLHDLKEVIGK